MNIIPRRAARALLAVTACVALVLGAAPAAHAIAPGSSSPTPATVEADPAALPKSPGSGGSATADALAVLRDGAPPAARLAAAETGALSGVVEAEGHGPVAGADVLAYQTDDAGGYAFVAATIADVDGTFRFDSLPVGTYDLLFSPPADGWDGIAWGWLGGGPNPQFPGPLTVIAGENTLPSVHTMREGVTISGVVKSESGLKPLSGVPVTLWASNGPDDGMLQFWPVEVAATTDGLYSIPHLPTAHYVFRFDAPSAKYAGEWWRNRASFETSDILFTEFAGEEYVVNANLRSRVDLGTVTVSGASATGATLVANHRKSSGTTYRYGWFADGTYISGASKSTFVPTAAQEHKRITVRVTGSKTGVVATTKSSDPRGKTLRTSVPSISGAPVIKNTDAVDESWWKGSTLTANPGTWTSGASLAYQWYADGRAIAGANSRTYTLEPVDRYKRITVKVTGSKADYGTFGRASAATTRVATLGRVVAMSNPSASRFGYRAWPQGVFPPDAQRTFSFYADGVLVQQSSSEALNNMSRYVGKRLQVRMTIGGAGYATYHVYSEVSSPVTP